MGQQRPFFLSPIATDQILKRLSNEMRSARLQAQDLGRTNQFVNTLLSKNDVKDLEKPEVSEPLRSQQVVNGGMPFRQDPKTRFSDPPAPPPQQPLPEKPTLPSLKRGPTERPKSAAESASPTRAENLAQIVQLSEALQNAKRDIDTQNARMRELEAMLQREREARELAEDLAKRLEESSGSHLNGAPVLPNDVTTETPKHVLSDTATITPEDDVTEVEASPAAGAAATMESATFLQDRIDTMENQMNGLREQVDRWKQRCEAAESERDADRKTLAEMVVQLREEEARRVASQSEKRSRSGSRRAEPEHNLRPVESRSASSGDREDDATIPQADGSATNEEIDQPTLSRANTITPMSTGRRSAGQRHMQAGMPYASALGVVLIGMGLMAYINGWQAPPPAPIER